MDYFIVNNKSSLNSIPDNTPGIYFIFNIANYNLYIGKSKNLKRRLYNHKHTDFTKNILSSNIPSTCFALPLDSKFLNSFETEGIAEEVMISYLHDYFLLLNEVIPSYKKRELYFEKVIDIIEMFNKHINTNIFTLKHKFEKHQFMY